MGLCLFDANNLLNRAVIFVFIQLKPVLYAYIYETKTKNKDLMTLSLSYSYWCENFVLSIVKYKWIRNQHLPLDWTALSRGTVFWRILIANISTVDFRSIANKTLVVNISQ
jgi:hypothetical protein